MIGAQDTVAMVGQALQVMAWGVGSVFTILAFFYLLLRLMMRFTKRDKE